MLSIHCQIWNLEKGQKVALQRFMRGETTLISVDETIQSSVDSRFFLAQRRLSTGQMVFFLSIIEVTREKDEGEYTCKVINSDLTPVSGASESVEAKVQFFPSEPSPECFPQQAGKVKSGTRISFNCTSVDGNPPVEITWQKTGSKEILPAAYEGHENGIVYSRLELVASKKYNEAVFICMISSSAFPDIKARTCTIGPLTVIPDPLNPEPDEQGLDDNDKEQTKPGGKSEYPVSIPGKDENGNNNNVDSLSPADCSEVCSSLDSPAFYWIIATVVAAILALLFLIIGIVIAIKLCHMPNNHHNNNMMDQSIYRQPLEGLYERLEYGREDLRNPDRMYMALHGLRKPDNLVVQTNIPVEIEGNYTRTPTAPGGLGGAPHEMLPGAPPCVLPGAPGGPCGPPEGRQTPVTFRPITPCTPDKLS